MNKKLSYIIPIIILVIFTIIFYFSNLDIKLESYFYNEKLGWFLKDAQPWRFIYKKFPILSFVFALSGLIVFILGFFMEKLLKYRKIGIFLFLLMIIGPGIIVNSIFKDYWGRPRPRNIKEFGGIEKHLKILIKGEYKPKERYLKKLNKRKGKVWTIIKKFYKAKNNNNSFPSGHASVAFFMIFPGFIFINKKKKIAYLLYCLGFLYGLIMGLTRVVQGAHFPSDVLWAWAFVHLTALTLYYLLKMDKEIYYRK